VNLAALLERSATTLGDQPAVGVGREVLWDYVGLRRRVAALGHGLAQHYGLTPGDRVAILMANRAEYVEALFALWWAGLVAVPINAKLHVAECAYVLEHAGARLCITDDVHLAAAGPATLVAGSSEYDALVGQDQAAQPYVDRAPDDLAWLFYTSGTTGRPKGAMLTHRSLLAMTTSYHADIDAIGPDDVLVHAAPMSHGSGLYLVPFVGAAATNVVPSSGGFDSTEVVELFSHWRSTTLFMAPTMVHRLLAEQPLSPGRCEGLRRIVYGGGPMYLDDVLRGLDALGPRLAQIYGQGESPMTITALPAWAHDRAHPNAESRLRSTGFARTGVEVAVVGEDGTRLPVGEVGEVTVRGDVVMAGYWQDDAATTQALRGGWLHTGDLGFLDEAGFLTLQDRSKDLIISGGSNIYPREVEEVLLQHPDVDAVSVVGRPDPEWGETVVAFVVASVGEVASLGDRLDTWCLDHIARFKRPKEYRFVESLPKNNYGKVLKTELRSQLAAEGDG
jgi:long-chain acyl-CoA synthetase